MDKIIISEEDVEKVEKYQWHKDKTTGYWYTYADGVKLYLHRYITNNQTSNPTDHIDKNKDNNTRENLRICTYQENARNKSFKSNNQTGYTNIFKHGKKFIIQARINNKTKTLASFDTLENALKAKVQMWKEMFQIDYTQDYYSATMDIFGIDKDIQEIVLETLEGETV
jgi:hypothetical protein